MTEIKCVCITSNWTWLNCHLSFVGMGKFQWISSINFIQENSEQLSCSNGCKCKPHCWPMGFFHSLSFSPSTSKALVLRHRGLHSATVFRWAECCFSGTRRIGFPLVVFSTIRMEPSKPCSVATSSCQVYLTCVLCLSMCEGLLSNMHYVLGGIC